MDKKKKKKTFLVTYCSNSKIQRILKESSFKLGIKNFSRATRIAILKYWGPKLKEYNLRPKEERYE